MPEETLRQRTVHYLEQLRQGEIRELYGALAPQMAAQLSLYQLSEMAQQLNWLTGAYQKMRSESAQTLAEGKTLVTDEVQYTRMVVRAQFVYDAQGSIEQFGLRPIEEQRVPYVPLGTAAYREEPIKLGREPMVDGLLTLPKQVEKPPVVILIQGSGQSDMHESVGALPNRPFAELAHGLAERGIATLRFNKRFYQYPPQSAEAVAAITVEQEILADARAAIAWAGQDKRLDERQIFALGHSLGGYLMPRLAAEEGELRGVIVMNGPWRPIPVILAEQKRVLLAANDHLSAEQKAEAQAEIDGELAKLADPAEQGVVFGQPMGYWRSLEQDHQQCLERTRAAVLVLQGEYDFQVDGLRELALWQAALAGRPESSCRSYPKLSHLMSPAADKSFNIALYDQPCPLADEVIRDIGQWVKGLSRR